MKLKLELDPRWAGGIQLGLLDALRRAARADTLELAETILRGARAAGQAIVKRSGQHLSISCTMGLIGLVRCAVIVQAVSVARGPELIALQQS